jgi:hypothetical protein
MNWCCGEFIYSAFSRMKTRATSSIESQTFFTSALLTHMGGWILRSQRKMKGQKKNREKSRRERQKTKKRKSRK